MTTTKVRQTPTLRQLESEGETILPFDERFLRTAPVQKRSKKTLQDLVSAAQELLSDPDIGRELLTTALVAEKVGVSIGILYRYFEDEIAIMDYVWPQRRDTIMIRWEAVSATATEIEVEATPESFDSSNDSTRVAS